MRRSLALRIEPSLRQTNAILERVQRSMTERGVRVEREAAAALRFTVPPPWVVPSLGPMLAVSRGRVTVSAGAGERRQVRYELRFTTLQVAVGVATLIFVAAGWRLPRVTLLVGGLAIWALGYFPLYFLAQRRFHAVIIAGARDVIERRATPRISTAVDETPTTQ